MKQRNHAFDLLCGLCIVRMIMLHTISVCGYRGEYWFGKVMVWSFFFMSFFFFKAGYFNKGVRLPFVQYLKDRTRRLLVPYTVWGAIGSLVFFAFIWIFPEHTKAIARQVRWNHVWSMSHFYGNPPCWFLFSFFSAYIGVFAIERLDRYIPRWKYLKPVLILTFPFVSYALFIQHNPIWMSLNNLFMGIYFFYLGNWWNKVQKSLPRRQFILLSLLLAAGFILSNKFMHGEYDMSLNKFDHSPWGAVVSTTLALLGISGILLSAKVKRTPLLGFIGEHSMVFFVMHYPIIHIYRFLHSVFHHSMSHHWEDFIILTVLITVTCSLSVPYFEKNKWLSGRC